MTLIKQDIGIKDVPLPVDDNELVERFRLSALREFSVRSPRIETCYIGDDDRIESKDVQHKANLLTYRIPKHYYLDSELLGVCRVDVSRTLGFSDFYIPQGAWASPDMVLETISDVQLSAAIGQSMSHAITHRFMPPDKIQIFNGWAGGSYEVDILLLHDLNLTTISPTAFTYLKQLTILDIEEFLYNKLKRIENLEVGIGSIQLKIDSWEGAAQAKSDLLQTWDETVNLNFDSINHY